MPSLGDAFVQVVGPANVFVSSQIEERYRSDIVNRFRSTPGWLVRPGTTEEVAKVVRIAADHNLPITALGGRTGLVGGGMAEDGGVILSLERMRRIVEIDRRAMTMTVEAGATLQEVHEAAEAKGLLMPLDLGARGSATIGGNIATNAGGVRVLRWGMMRDMVIGLEAVLADGSVVSSLTKALKDNAGYAWKHLLIGSEGTLGIVTRAVLRLRPLPTSTQTALVALDGFEQAATLLRRLEADLAGQLSTFELMWENFYAHVSEIQLAKRRRPIPTGYPIYALIEALGCNDERDKTTFEQALAAALAEGLIREAVIARSERERGNLWAVRDDLGEAAAALEPFVTFDVSMALSDMEHFVSDSRARLVAQFPTARVMYYGHAGDGNLHLFVCPKSLTHDEELAIEEAVYRAVQAVGGSISAEHGVGQAKRQFLGMTRSPREIALMRSIKAALDPRNILNPNKIFSA